MPSDSRVIKLESGGTLTFKAEINLFALTAADRELLSDLVDRLDEYGARAFPPPPASIAPSDDNLAKESTSTAPDHGEQAATLSQEKEGS